MVPIAEFEAIRVETEGELGFRSDHIAEARADYLRGVRLNSIPVVPGDLSLRVVLVRDGEVVAAQHVTVSVGTSAQAVTVVISRNCRDVECPSTGNPTFDSCLGGRCVDPHCSPETPEFCPPAACERHDDCQQEVPTCADPYCASGTCFAQAVTSRCAVGEFCDGSYGCRVIPGRSSTDAGASDASASDTSALDTNVWEGDGSSLECETGAEEPCGLGHCSGLRRCSEAGRWLSCEGPSASLEICNQIDDDCDGITDEGVELTWYIDEDDDGYGGSATHHACEQPDGFVGVGDDCDDTEMNTHPDAADICNGIDDDCHNGADPGGSCGCFAYHLLGHVYQVCETLPGLTWSDAQSWCEARGYSLVSLSSSLESGAVDMWVASGDRYWVGLNDRATESTFVWSSGEPLTRTEWDAAEPDNSGDCVVAREGGARRVMW